LRKVVANQIDRCDASAIDAIRTLEPDVIYLSATEGTGLIGLRNWLEKQFWDDAATPESLTQQRSCPDHG
jgi:GTP-binding protein HflX